jgi:hypothetical protein
MHMRGVVHGRVSSACILMHGDEPRSKGELASPRDLDLCVSFQSPERIDGGPSSRRDDTWATAVTLYHALSGKSPFAGESDEEVRNRIRAGAPPPLASFGVADTGLQKIFDKAFARDMASRFAEVAELRRALEAWQPSARFERLQPLDEVEIEPPPSFRELQVKPSDETDGHTMPLFRDDVMAQVRALGSSKLQLPTPAKPEPPPVEEPPTNPQAPDHEEADDHTRPLFREDVISQVRNALGARGVVLPSRLSSGGPSQGAGMGVRKSPSTCPAARKSSHPPPRLASSRPPRLPGALAPHMPASRPVQVEPGRSAGLRPAAESNARFAAVATIAPKERPASRATAGKATAPALAMQRPSGLGGASLTSPGPAVGAAAAPAQAASASLGPAVGAAAAPAQAASASLGPAVGAAAAPAQAASASRSIVEDEGSMELAPDSALGRMLAIAPASDGPHEEAPRAPPPLAASGLPVNLRRSVALVLCAALLAAGVMAWLWMRT